MFVNGDWDNLKKKYKLHEYNFQYKGFNQESLNQPSWISEWGFVNDGNVSDYRLSAIADSIKEDRASTQGCT